MAYAVTFLEGIITFISPCLLPLLPVYVAYFAGGIDGGNATGAAEGVATGAAEGFAKAAAAATAAGTVTGTASGTHTAPKSGATMRRTLVSAIGFVLGFGFLFTLMGAFAGSIGSFFTANQQILNIVCGALVVVFGLHFAGILNIPALQRTLRPKTREPRGFLTSLLFGMVFAIGWTPCVGAFLGSALSLAAAAGSATQGVLLLVCYSLGLGIPFILAAVLIDQLEGAFSWIKRHYKAINIACGMLLVVVGVLMATGQLGKWLALLSL